MKNAQIPLKKVDEKIIYDIVKTYPNESFEFLRKMLYRIFNKDIQPQHFAALGYWIGQSVAPKKPTKNKNHFITWQRPN